MRERELFLTALEIEGPAARQAYLKTECGDDVALLARVESLLASHEEQSRFLNTPVVEQLANESGARMAATMLTSDSSTQDENTGENNVSSATAASQYSGSTKVTKHDDSDEEASLGYLEPSTKPGSLGRLGHYEVLEVVGRGAFGTVLRAFDEKLHRVVAIKVMSPEMAATSPARKRFIREAQSSAAIRHEHVVSVYAVEEKPLPYLVMEFIPGETLQQRLDGHGPLDVPTVLRIGKQIAEGLAAAHAQDLIHRDIKPANILLETGVREMVKVTDFGLARAADDASLTQSGTIAGTPMYMAPEQAMGHKLDQRADLFSLGSVLYQTVSGRPPFRANGTLAVLKRVTEDAPRPIREIIPETPQWLCDIISKLHAKNPDERFQTAREVADLLGRCQSELQLNGKVTCVNVGESLRDSHSESQSDSASYAETLDHRSPVLRDGNTVAAPRMGESQTTPSPSKPKRSIWKTVAIAMFISFLAVPQLARVLKPAFDAWMWPPIPVLAETDVPGGLQFDGRDDYVEVGPLDWAFPQFTIEAFVTSDASSDNGTIAYLTSKGDMKKLEWMSLYDGSPSQPGQRLSGAAIVGTTKYATASGPFAGGVRQHRVLVFDGYYMHYYINGIWQGKRRSSAYTGMVWQMKLLRFGCDGSERRFFQGKIDQVRISKIARYSNNFAPVTSVTSDGSTLALYNFDEGKGDVLKDASGNGRDGKIHGATWVRKKKLATLPERTLNGEADREVAEWVIKNGGQIKLLNQGQWIEKVANMPTTPFVVTHVILKNVSNFTVADAQRLTRLRELVHIGFQFTTHAPDSIKALAECQHLQELVVVHCPTTDSTLAEVLLIPQLRAIDFTGVAVTDDVVARLGNVSQILDLQIYGCPRVSESGLIRLSSAPPPKLKWLSWGNMKLSSAGMKAIASLPHLHTLTLSNLTLDDAGLSELTQSPTLSQIVLDRTSGMTKAATAELQQKLGGCQVVVTDPKLAPPIYGPAYRETIRNLMSRGFSIGITSNEAPGTAWIQGDGAFPPGDVVFVQGVFSKHLADPTAPELETTDLQMLAQLTDLPGITVSKVPTGGLRELLPLKNMTSLVLGNSPLTEADFALLPSFRKLSELVVVIPSRSALETVAALPHLSRLTIGVGSTVTDDDLKVLESVRTLSTLDLGTVVSREAAQAFANARPDVHVNWKDGIRLEPVAKEVGHNPNQSPPLAIAPFNAEQAKAHQVAWAKHLGVPVEFTNSLGMKFRLIPPGEFQMGYSQTEVETLVRELKQARAGEYDQFSATSSGPLHKVRITKPFYMSVHEVTVAQYRKFIDEARYMTTAEQIGGDHKKWTDYLAADNPDQRPALGVSWTDAEAYCVLRSEREGIQYRLPSEAEWEYACRAGTTSLWSFGNNPSDLNQYAVVSNTEFIAPEPVGNRKPNPFGLHDMYGNAEEWCRDWHRADFYATSPVNDPVSLELPADKNSGRVTRGGGFVAALWQTRSSTRRWDFPSTPVGPKGFRVVISGDLSKAVPEQAALRKSSFPPLDPAWVERVSKLPAEEQVKEVATEMKRRNPEWDGKFLEIDILSGRVTGVRMDGSQIVDLGPIALLKQLRKFTCYAKNRQGRLKDLSPLTELSELAHIDFGFQIGLSDLTPLANLPIGYANLPYTAVSDLSPLKGKEIRFLQLLGCRKVTDISPLQRTPFYHLYIHESGIQDITPLKDSPLQLIHLVPSQFNPDVVLTWRSLKNINLDWKAVPREKLLRLKEIKTLETIDGQPVAEFWKEFEK